MNRMTISIVGVLLCLIACEASAQQPSQIGLRINLQGKLRSLCLPAGGKIEDVERDLATSLVRHIYDAGYWTQFCWRIKPFDANDAYQGLVQITLREMPSDIAEIRVSVSVGPAAANKTFQLTAFAEGNLLEGRGTAFPRGEELRDFVHTRFTDICLTPAKVEELHHRLRAKIRVGTGMVIHNFAAAASDPHGIILLPWDEFNSFGEAKFKFRWRAAASPEELDSQGMGVPDTVTLPTGGPSLCCLLTKHQKVPVMPPPGPVDVYLDMTIQDILLLPGPATSSACSNVASDVTIITPFQ